MSDNNLKTFHFEIKYTDFYQARARSSEEVQKMIDEGILEPYDSQSSTTDIEQIKCSECIEEVKNHYPVRQYGIDIQLNLEPITLSVECDESQFNAKAKEYSQDIIDNVVEQVKKQIEDLEVDNGIVVVDKQEVEEFLK